MNRPAVMELDRATKIYRIGSPFAGTTIVRALDEVSFRITGGRALALVGESGSGKSTCARAIAGLIGLTSGRILFRGAEVSAVFGRKARLAYAGSVQMVFQDPFSALNPTHTVRHHLARSLRLHGRGRGNLEAEVRRALVEVDLQPDLVLRKYPHELSGGELQRVNLARALAVGAELIVADEPTSMLDMSIRRSVLDLMLRLKHAHGIGFVLITHDIATASYFADDIAVMFAGRIVEQGPADAILADPRHAYSRLLLSALPRAENRHAQCGSVGPRFADRARTVRAATRASEADLVEWRPGHFVRDTQMIAADQVSALE